MQTVSGSSSPESKTSSTCFLPVPKARKVPPDRKGLRVQTAFKARRGPKDPKVIPVVRPVRRGRKAHKARWVPKARPVR